MYKTIQCILHTFNLQQDITVATRKNKSLIDQIFSNIPNKLVQTNVIVTEKISDHGTPYVIVNIRKERYEPRYKYIRDGRRLTLKFTYRTSVS